MPRELIATGPSQAALQMYKEQVLANDEVRVRTLFSSPKHGSGLRSFRANTKDYTSPFDRKRGIHHGPPMQPTYPQPLGNMAVGEVIEVGVEVDQWGIGDHVFSHLPIRDTHTLKANRVQPVPSNMSPQAIVYNDPAGVALCAIQASEIMLGSTVAVFGLGAIGQMAAQQAKLQGARQVFVSDPILIRRELAIKHGADIAIDPSSDNAGELIRDHTNNVGVDISIEASANYAGMNDAIRSTGYAGRIVSAAYYVGDSSILSFEGEWHRNQLTILTTRDVNPTLRNAPRWDTKRLHNEAFELLKEERLSVDGLIHPIVPFEDCVEAYLATDQRPSESIKLGIRHT